MTKPIDDETWATILAELRQLWASRSLLEDRLGSLEEQIVALERRMWDRERQLGRADVPQA